MTDVFRVADLLVAHAVESHGEEIDLIGYYGSYAQGAATAHSDLDLFCVPAEGKTPPVARVALISGILFDFWPITWETMEGFATGRVRGWAHAPALVRHAQVLYARSEAATERLAGLRQKTIDLQRPEARAQMIRRALDAFVWVSAHLGNVRLAAGSGSLVDVRHSGWRLVSSVLECLALANQVFLDRGPGAPALLERLSTLPAKPADLEQLIAAIVTSAEATEVAAAAEALALETRQALRQCQASLPARHAAVEEWQGNYPEISDQLGKVLSACEKREEVAASWAAWNAQHDVALLLADLGSGAGNHPDFNLYSESAGLYQEIGLPDLLGNPASDLQALTEQVSRFNTRMRDWLGEQSLDLQEFATVEDFERSLL